MAFISIALRALLNLESLSGVETVGNLARHRTAPIVIPTKDGYTVRFLPVLSGESIAHAYQELLVEEAIQRDLPISSYSRRFEFLKFSDDQILKEEGLSPPVKEDEIRKTEVAILLSDYVADVGGFLYAGNIPVKRTSCFQVGYAIPAINEEEVAALESQFHVRFAPSSKNLQMPYNVEVGSALYTFTFNIDLSRIGVPSTQFGDVDKNNEDRLSSSRVERINGALSAVVKLFSYLSFGAKRSRFLPNMQPVSLVASYSKGLKFIVSPGNGKDYIPTTVERKDALINTINRLSKEQCSATILAFDKEGAAKGLQIPIFNSVEEVLKELVSLAQS
ncbi:MAG: type I-A CRISPR-associated protein Cas7/Csa2 [Nitrososphaerales archaeon]